MTWTRTEAGNHRSDDGLYRILRDGRSWTLYGPDSDEPITEKGSLACCKDRARHHASKKEAPAQVRSTPAPASWSHDWDLTA